MSISHRNTNDLPKARDPHIYSLVKESSQIRRELASDFMRPVIKAVESASRKDDGHIYASEKRRIKRFISKLKRNTLSQQVSSLDGSIDRSITRSLNESSRKLRAINIKVDSKLNDSRKLKVKARINLNRSKRALSQVFDRVEQHAFAYVDKASNKKKFKRQVVDSSFTPTKGGSLSKAIRKIRRTELQNTNHTTSREMFLEHGITYCYWRLSVNHKDYGGREVCEVLASSTGSRATLSSHSKIGLYHLAEYPSVPHPNCMCQMDPAG